MKRMMTTAICLSVLLCGAVLSSCGGGIGSVKENKYLGKVPGIYVNLAKAYDQLGEDLKAAGTDSGDPPSEEEFQGDFSYCGGTAPVFFCGKGVRTVRSGGKEAAADPESGAGGDHHLPGAAPLRAGR